MNPTNYIVLSAVLFPRQTVLGPAHHIIPAAAAAGYGGAVGYRIVAELDVVDVAVVGGGAFVDRVGSFPAFHMGLPSPALKVRVELHGTAGCPVDSHSLTT